MTALTAMTELTLAAARVAEGDPGPNPLLPTGYDIAFSVMAIAILGLAVWALVVLVKRQDDVSLVEFFVWLAVILMFPVLGAGVYLLARGRGRRGQAAPAAAPAAPDTPAE
ncbi:PLDc N-terminal domain-containing protein [Leucobacter chromiireducens]|uniref:PLDc N-terminal domain-containing protein n=1 Tax=Leucobacter chromiireducens TaxID=283877 RepID=UPI000F63BA83|nr:PLD nuclease N-terminal domain-containing protein [Leucobacter chromiireducens]